MLPPEWGQEQPESEPVGGDSEPNSGKLGSDPGLWSELAYFLFSIPQGPDVSCLGLGTLLLTLDLHPNPKQEILKLSTLNPFTLGN